MNDFHYIHSVKVYYSNLYLQLNYFFDYKLVGIPYYNIYCHNIYGTVTFIISIFFCAAQLFLHITLRGQIKFF